MVIKLDQGWLGADGQFYATADEARASLEQRREQRVYEIAASAAASRPAAEEIMQLEPIFTAMEDPIIYALANDGEPIAERLDESVPHIKETTLRQIAIYEWERRTQERDAESVRADARSRGIRDGAAIAGIILSALALVVKLVGWV